MRIGQRMGGIGLQASVDDALDHVGRAEREQRFPQGGRVDRKPRRLGESADRAVITSFLDVGDPSVGQDAEPRACPRHGDQIFEYPSRRLDDGWQAGFSAGHGLNRQAHPER